MHSYQRTLHSRSVQEATFNTAIVKICRKNVVQRMLSLVLPLVAGCGMHFNSIELYLYSVCCNLTPYREQRQEEINKKLLVLLKDSPC